MSTEPVIPRQQPPLQGEVRRVRPATEAYPAGLLQEPSQLSLGRGRKIFVGKDIFGLGAILEVVSQRDLVVGLRETRHIDTAEAIILPPGRSKIVTQGHLEPVKRDLGVGGFIPRHY